MGALPLLLGAYPEARVVFHEYEAPFLVGSQHFVRPGSLAARVLRWAGLLGEQPVKASSSLLGGKGGEAGCGSAW